MFLRVSLLVALGLAMGVVLSSPLHDTNAARLARGLPLLPPQFVRDLLDGRSLPTPVLKAKRAQTSPLPPITLNGRLQIRSREPGSSGSALGNIRNWSGGGTISGTNFLGPEQDLRVALTYNPSDPTRFDIVSTNAAFPAPFYVGAGTFSTVNSPVLGFGSPFRIPFTNVEQTSPNSVPVTPPGRDAFVESAIWTINPNTKQLTAQWINPDGSTPLTELAYDIRNNALFFVGDISLFNQGNPFPASVVDLFLIDL